MVDRFGVFVFVASTVALLFSVHHFIVNQKVLDADNYPLWFSLDGMATAKPKRLVDAQNFLFAN